MPERRCWSWVPVGRERRSIDFDGQVECVACWCCGAVAATVVQRRTDPVEYVCVSCRCSFLVDGQPTFVDTICLVMKVVGDRRPQIRDVQGSAG